jgi:uncharacterized protein YqgV (UPF0045/DUF77 family)
MNNTINIGFQLVPLARMNNIEIIDGVIAILQSKGYRYEVNPFETVVECTFEQGTQLMNEINDYCNGIDELARLLYIRIHAKTGEDILMSSKTEKHRK